MPNIDPRLGTWRLDVAKSKFSSAWMAMMKMAPPKEEKLAFREVGADEIELTITGTQTDGRPISGKSTSPRQGGAVKLQESPLPEGMSVVSTKIDPNNSIATYMLNGKQVFTAQLVVSKNAKSMRITFRGMDAQGKPFEQLGVFVKQ
jgi:hypothetical protein